MQCSRYWAACLNEESERSRHSDLPPQFEPLFNFLEGIGSVYRNFMRNGSGKLLVYNLLCLTGARLVKISTTTDPRNDWCIHSQAPYHWETCTGLLTLQVSTTTSRCESVRPQEWPIGKFGKPSESKMVPIAAIHSHRCHVAVLDL